MFTPFRVMHATDVWKKEKSDGRDSVDTVSSEVCEVLTDEHVKAIYGEQGASSAPVSKKDGITNVPLRTVSVKSKKGFFSKMFKW